MAVMVLGKHDPKKPKHGRETGGRPPAELGRMPPPDVNLTEQQAGDGALPREAPEKRRHDDIGERSQQPVQQHPRVQREDGMIEVGAAPVVMRAQMQREP